MGSCCVSVEDGLKDVVSTVTVATTDATKDTRSMFETTKDLDTMTRKLFDGG
jgi:hypothetical protein